LSRILDAIDRESEAADALTRACARQGALSEWIANNNPSIGTSLRQAYRTASTTPADMIQILGKLK
jgi:hypothetical protein